MAVLATSAGAVDVFDAGPQGVPLIAEGPGSSDEKLLFEPKSQTAVEGQILNSDKTFDPSRLPAIFFAKFKDGSACTATLIGPQVILTAAHCIDLKFQNSVGEWQTVPGGIQMTAGANLIPFTHCEMAPAYAAAAVPATRTPRNTHDFAMCEIGQPLGLNAEHIRMDGSTSAAARVLLAGYGCAEEDLVGGRIPANSSSANSKLRVGFNRLSTDRIDSWVPVPGRIKSKDAIICPGDSGGAVYAGVGDIVGSQEDHDWHIVAINSAVGPSKRQKAIWDRGRTATARDGAEYISYLSLLSDPAFKELLTRFMGADPDKNPARAICGINRHAPDPGCRPNA